VVVVGTGHPGEAGEVTQTSQAQVGMGAVVQAGMECGRPRNGQDMAEVVPVAAGGPVVMACR